MAYSTTDLGVSNQFWNESLDCRGSRASSEISPTVESESVRLRAPMTAARAARAARAAAAGLGWATCRLRLCAFCGSWDRLGTRIFKY